MKVSLSQYSALADDENGNQLRFGKFKFGCSVLTAAGSFPATDADTSFIRIATDTAIHVGFGHAATASSEFMPAGTSEYFAVNGGEVISIIRA